MSIHDIGRGRRISNFGSLWVVSKHNGSCCIQYSHHICTGSDTFHPASYCLSDTKFCRGLPRYRVVAAVPEVPRCTCQGHEVYSCMLPIVIHWPMRQEDFVQVDALACETAKMNIIEQSCLQSFPLSLSHFRSRVRTESMTPESPRCCGRRC